MANVEELLASYDPDPLAAEGAGAAGTNPNTGSQPPFTPSRREANWNPAVDEEAREQPRTGMHILLVDEDLLQLTRLAKKLRADGYNVSTARSGKEGLRVAASDQPRIILADWRVACVDGNEFCKSLRATAEGRDIYVIMLTPVDDERALTEVFESGADDFIDKPIADRVLTVRVRAGQRYMQLQDELRREKENGLRIAADLEHAKQQLHTLGLTDDLTKLPNRRFAIARLDEQWAAMKRCQLALNVMILDLDHFGQINDSLGRRAGDDVLAHVARVIRESVRAEDIVCRMDGANFFILTTNTEAQDAETMAERLRGVIEEQQPRGIHLPRPVTISIGAAVAYPSREAAGWEDLLNRANQALSEIKDAGRNGVRVIPPP